MFARRDVGFTLVELLVVISIIAILAIIGLTIFTNVTKSSRDAKRKADINAIAKSYEVKYLTNSQYNAQSSSDFSQNVIPKPPENSSSDYFNFLASDHTGFLACAALEAHPTRTCNSTSSTCFCKSSTQGKMISTSPDPGSTNISMGLSGSGLQHPDACDPNGTLDDNLVSYWKMNEAVWNGTANEVIDSSGNGNNGTASCSSCNKPTTGAGKFSNGGVWDANGASQQVNVNSSSTIDIGLESMSWSMWYKTSSASRVGLYRKSGGANANGVLIDLGNSLDQARCFINSSPSAAASTISSTYHDGNWHQLTCVLDRNNAQLNLYIDGTLKNSVSASSLAGINLADSNVASLGNASGVPLNGNLDDFRIYKRALSPTEITNLYGTNPPGSGCIP